MIKSLKQILVMLTVMIGLAACSSQRLTVHLDKNFHKKQAYGELCSWKDLNAKALKLQNSDIFIKTYGDDQYLFIPTKLLFSEQNISFWKDNAKASKIMKAIVDYLDCYRKMTIEVRVYTTVLSQHQEARSLTQMQANDFVDHLVAKGVHAQLIYGKGRAFNLPENMLIIKTRREFE